MQICKQKQQRFRHCKHTLAEKPNNSLSLFSTKPKPSNLSYENIVNHYLDEDTVIPEAILPDDKWLNGCRSDIEVALGINRERGSLAKEKERNITACLDFMAWALAGQSRSQKKLYSSNWPARLQKRIQKEHAGPVKGLGPRLQHFESESHNFDHKTAWKSHSHYTE